MCVYNFVESRDHYVRVMVMGYMFICMYAWFCDDLRSLPTGIVILTFSSDPKMQATTIRIRTPCHLSTWHLQPPPLQAGNSNYEKRHP